MTQWEYRKINLNDLPRRTEDIDVLTDVGEEGWELVIISVNSIAYLKRPIEGPAPAQETAPPTRATQRKTATAA
jgi:hypothetical protein